MRLRRADSAVWRRSASVPPAAGSARRQSPQAGHTVNGRPPVGNVDAPPYPTICPLFQTQDRQTQTGRPSAIARKLACTGRKQITVFALGSLLGKEIAEKSPPTVSAKLPGLPPPRSRYFRTGLRRAGGMLATSHQIQPVGSGLTLLPSWNRPGTTRDGAEVLIACPAYASSFCPELARLRDPVARGIRLRRTV